MRAFADRLWSKVDIRGPDECWPWAAGKHKGYGRLRKFVNGKWTHISAAKAVWEEVNGPMPRGYVPDHTCCDTGCCNPGHVEAVTNSVNSLRIWQRRRGTTTRNSGTSNGRAKLTRKQVIAILNDPRPSRKVAKDYGVDKTAILRVRKKLTYKTDTAVVLHHL